MLLKGKVTDVTVSDLDYDYTVNGKMDIDIDYSLDFDMIVGSSTAIMNMNMDYSYAFKYGVAYSVLRSDGVGAKFVIAFYKAGGDTNVTMVDEDLFAGMAGDTAELTVYNDANEVIFEGDVSLDNFWFGPTDFE